MLLPHKDVPMFSFDVNKPIDLAQVAEEASKDGLVEQHQAETTNSHALPNVLALIRNKRKQFRDKQLDKAQARLHELQVIADEGRGRVNASVLESEIITQSKNFAEFDYNSRLATIDSAGEDYIGYNHSLIKYKKYHGIALMPVNANKKFWSIYGVLVLIFIIEASMNAAMFKEIGGLIVAYTLSIAQSFVNIASCFLIGSKVIGAAIYAKSKLMRLMSWLLIASHVVFILWLNLALGLWRAINLEDPMAMAMSPETLRIALAPFSHLDLYEMTSALVAAVGLVLAVLAYLKGYYSDDPHPGYGSRYRSAKTSRLVFTGTIASVLKEWKSACQEYSLGSKRVRRWALDGIDGWSTSINEMEKIHVDLTNLLESMNVEFKQACDIYLENYTSASISEKPFNLDPDLFNEREMDVRILLLDVAQYFLTDKERLAKRDELVAELDREFEQVNTVFADKIADVDLKVKTLSAKIALPIGSVAEDRSGGYFLVHSHSLA